MAWSDDDWFVHCNSGNWLWNNVGFGALFGLLCFWTIYVTLIVIEKAWGKFRQWQDYNHKAVPIQGTLVQKIHHDLPRTRHRAPDDHTSEDTDSYYLHIQYDMPIFLQSEEEEEREDEEENEGNGVGAHNTGSITRLRVEEVRRRIQEQRERTAAMAPLLEEYARSNEQYNALLDSISRQIGAGAQDSWRLGEDDFRDFFHRAAMQANVDAGIVHPFSVETEMVSTHNGTNELS
ncbi:expressed unknown protein [Seminavis robusta]|uniref:Uncharacterized protein n=1 Tax=Seminavis robusta TaxID=568900 RepID=A0A9N8D8Q5_9STRA|nr:expressed unknown protein [Seminavis robusta]|eukprot:Sro42_g025740.1 n/a (234) ;mRNA; f:105986-106772